MSFRERFFAIPFAVRLAFTCWAILLVGVCGRVLLSKPGSQSVVPIYLNAAERWMAGEDIYAPAAGLDVYRNPPGFAASFTAFTLLPDKVAGVAWRLLSAAVLLLGLHPFALATNLTRVQAGYFFALVTLLAVPSVNNGQVNVLLIGSVLLGFTLAKEGRLGPAAIWLAVATGLKLYPMAAAFLAMVVLPRLAGRYLVATVVVLALPFAFQSTGFVTDEYQSLMMALGHDDRTANTFLFRVPQDWTLVPRVWLGVVVAPAVTQFVSALAGLLFAIFVRTAPLATRWTTAFLLASIWMTLFGPATEIPTYTLLAPAAAWCAVVWPSIRTLLAVALLAAPILRAMFPSTELMTFRSAAPWAGMVLLLDLMLVSRRPESTILSGRAEWREPSVSASKQRNRGLMSLRSS